jgi:TolA-binding protein
MIFFWLALVAMVSGTLGFLAHTFYFGRRERVITLEKEIGSLTRILALHDQARTEAEQRSDAASGRIKSLELKLTEESEKRGALQARVLLQEEEIRELKEVASGDPIRAAEIVEQKSAMPEIKQPIPAEISGSGRKMPLWKDSLNNILSVLDKIEKERGS